MGQIIYILTNEAMPGIVKIGFTTHDSVETRVAELSRPAGVPLPFECHFAAEVDNCRELENKLHLLFADARINPRREFFRLDPEKVVLAISIGKFTEVTPGVAEIPPEEKQALERVKERRPPLKLDSIGIKPGDLLTLSRDETVTATVADGNKVVFDGQIISLSEAALRALQAKGYKTPAASGPGYWMFDGELLSDRRHRLEESQFSETSGTST